MATPHESSESRPSGTSDLPATAHAGHPGRALDPAAVSSLSLARGQPNSSSDVTPRGHVGLFTSAGRRDAGKKAYGAGLHHRSRRSFRTVNRENRG